MKIVLKKNGIVYNELNDHYNNNSPGPQNELIDYISLSDNHELFVISRDKKFRVECYPDVTLMTFPTVPGKSFFIKLINRFSENLFILFFMTKIKPNIFLTTHFSIPLFIWSLAYKSHLIPCYINPSQLESFSAKLLLKLSNMNKYINSILVCSHFLRDVVLSKGFLKNVSVYSFRYNEDFFIKREIDSSLNRFDRKILFVGRLEKSKGIYDIIEISKKVLEKTEGVHFFILGDGSERMDFTAKLISCGVDKHFTFLGSKPSNEIYSYMSKSEIVIIPSYYEGLGKVAIESVLSGTPFIAYKVGGLSEIQEKTKAGICIPPYSIDIFSEEIIKLFDQEQLLSELTCNALKSKENMRNPNNTFSIMIRDYIKNNLPDIKELHT
jgi:glycosyltransferase involved in cell wall biosynthesis